MAQTKFQVVFGPDSSVDLQILIDDEVRSTCADLQDAPFSLNMLGEECVRAVLKNWMLAANVPPWISWTDIESALVQAGIDFETLTAKYPASDID